MSLRLPDGFKACSKDGKACSKKARIESCHLTFVVKGGSELRVDETPVLITRLGTHLLDSGWMHIAIHLTCLLYTIFFFAPLSKVTYEAYDINGELRTLATVHPIQGLTSSLLCGFGTFLIAHQMNREIFYRTMFSFDFMIIFGSGALIQLTWYCNWYFVFIRVGSFDWYDVPIGVVQFIIAMSFYGAVGTMDSITMRYSRRIMICAVLIGNFLLDFILVRFGIRYPHFFAEETLDWWPLVTTPQEIYLSGKFELLLFLSKAAVAYIRGHPFACIKADYAVPGRQVLLNQVTERLIHKVSRTLSDSCTLSRGTWSWHSAGSCTPSSYRTTSSGRASPCNVREVVWGRESSDVDTQRNGNVREQMSKLQFQCPSDFSDEPEGEPAMRACSTLSL